MIAAAATLCDAAFRHATFTPPMPRILRRFRHADARFSRYAGLMPLFHTLRHATPPFSADAFATPASMPILRLLSRYAMPPAAAAAAAFASLFLPLITFTRYVLLLYYMPLFCHAMLTLEVCHRHAITDIAYH